MSATWEEIKALAADFQRAQLSSTTQKLAERNCHEIVSKLTDLGLIEVIFTNDRKSYLTPRELMKEIEEEVQVHGGRVNLVDIQQSISVDMSHIEKKAHQLVAESNELQLILGQLIHVSYIEQLCRDVNDQLQDVGQTTFAELTKQYDLPGDFLKREVTSRLGTFIFGKVDPSNNDVLYTDTYINRHKAKVRGLFSAVLKPTSISSLVSRHRLPEKLMISLLEELIATGRLKGTINSSKTTYLPDVYTRAQKTWIDNFYTQNGYLEYDSLSRLGVSDPKSYIKKTYGNHVILLNSCCVSEACLEGLEVAIEECLASDSYINAMGHLPSIVSPLDGSQLVQMSVKKHKKAVILADTFVTTQEFINKCAGPFEKLMVEKATKDLKSNSTVFSDSADKKMLMGGGGDDSKSKKEDKKSKSAGTQKTGGGTQGQGREVKTKAVKNKYKGKGGARDSDDEDTPTSSSVQKTLDFMDEDHIADVLEKDEELKQCPSVMIMEIAARLQRPLRDKYQEVAKDVYFKASSSSAHSSANKRKQLSVLEEKINNLYSTIQLYEKSIHVIEDDENLEAALTKYLLKSHCTELCNELVDWLGADHMISITEGTLDTMEGRAKVISNLPEDVKQPISKLHTSLNGKSMGAFEEALQEVLSPRNMGLLLKKADKKKDRQVQFNHRQALIEQLKEEQDLPASFHQAIVIIFGVVHQTMLHCTGKMIPQIVKQLQPHLGEDNYRLLSKCQDLIVQQVKGELEDEAWLQEVMSEVKEMACTLKKSDTQS